MAQTSPQLRNASATEPGAHIAPLCTCQETLIPEQLIDRTASVAYDPLVIVVSQIRAAVHGSRAANVSSNSAKIIQQRRLPARTVPHDRSGSSQALRNHTRARTVLAPIDSAFNGASTIRSCAWKRGGDPRETDASIFANRSDCVLGFADDFLREVKDSLCLHPDGFNLLTSGTGRVNFSRSSEGAHALPPASFSITEWQIFSGKNKTGSFALNKEFIATRCTRCVIVQKVNFKARCTSSIKK